MTHYSLSLALIPYLNQKKEDACLDHNNKLQDHLTFSQICMFHPLCSEWSSSPLIFLSMIEYNGGQHSIVFPLDSFLEKLKLSITVFEAWQTRHELS